MAAMERIRALDPPPAARHVDIDRLREHMLRVAGEPEVRLAMHDEQPDSQRAYDLLRSWLSPQQLKTWDEFNAFEVLGSETGTVYTIRPEPTFNVYHDETKDGVPLTQKYCAVLNIPFDQPELMGDRLLAQKILIETDEVAFLVVANKQQTLLSAMVRTLAQAQPHLPVLDDPPTTTLENTPNAPAPALP